jgi:hypothetical protein
MDHKIPLTNVIFSGSSHIHVKSSVPFVLSEVSPPRRGNVPLSTNWRVLFVERYRSTSSAVARSPPSIPQDRLRYLSRNSCVKGARVYDSAGTDHPFVLMYRRTNAHLRGPNSPVGACRSYFDTSARAGWSVPRQIPRRYEGTPKESLFLAGCIATRMRGLFRSGRTLLVGSWKIEVRSIFTVICDEPKDSIFRGSGLMRPSGVKGRESWRMRGSFVRRRSSLLR